MFFPRMDKTFIYDLHTATDAANRSITLPLSSRLDFLRRSVYFNQRLLNQGLGFLTEALRPVAETED
jgi:hypothetical protein